MDHVFIGTVNGRLSARRFVPRPVQRQVLCVTGFIGKSSGGNGFVYGFFRHFPVGRPLASCNGNQPGCACHKFMVSGNFFCGSGIVPGHCQGAKACKNAEDIFFFGSIFYILVQCIQYEPDFLFQGYGLQGVFAERRIGGAHQHVIVPGNGKKNPSVGRFRDHQRAGVAE